MVEFDYQPWKKIVIHEIVEFSTEYFLDEAARSAYEGGRSKPVNWANGIIFVTAPLPSTEDVIREQIKGTIHWGLLHFGRMRKYKAEVKRDRSVIVPLLDMSSHEVFGPMAEWIKKTCTSKELARRRK